MDTIRSWMERLGSKDGMTRQQARLALVEMGAAAVPDLVLALDSPNEHKRWEAAKALSAIHDSRATEALVQTLEDPAFGVRWLAANALIGIGEPALIPLLYALMRNSDSPRLREGAGHVLRSIGRQDEAFKERVAPVLDALESIEPAASTPWAAHRLLQQAGLIPDQP